MRSQYSPIGSTGLPSLPRGRVSTPTAPQTLQSGCKRKARVSPSATASSADAILLYRALLLGSHTRPLSFERQVHRLKVRVVREHPVRRGGVCWVTDAARTNAGYNGGEPSTAGNPHERAATLPLPTVQPQGRSRS